MTEWDFVAMGQPDSEKPVGAYGIVRFSSGLEPVWP